MQITKPDLLKIAEKASSLYERLDVVKPLILPFENIDPTPTINGKLEEWCHHVAKGEETKFTKRLSWEGLHQETIPQLFSSICYLHAPDWLSTLQTVINTTRKNPTETPHFIDKHHPIPFEELLLPFVSFCIETLQNQTGAAYDRLSAEAHATLERALLQRLSKIASLTFHLEFKTFQLYQKVMGHPSSSSHSLYSTFVDRMLTGEFVPFLKRYPVLARLLATTSDLWVGAMSEFLQRLAQDQKEIEHTFHDGKEIGSAIQIEAQLSDAHNEGRSVLIVTFVAGLKLVYKPRDLGIEEAYQGLLQWINQRGMELPFRCIQVLNKGTYGWSQYVEHLPCQQEAEVVRYYQRAGMLCCLLYLLQGTDFHYDNLIASGEYPMPIDLEMIFCPFLPVDGEIEHVADSVLNTGLLPVFDEAGEWDDLSNLSGLAGGSQLKTTFKEAAWEKVNQDDMSYQLLQRKIANAKNVVYLRGKRLSPSAYQRELVAGFRQMYHFFLQNRNEMLDAAGPISPFKGKRVRFVMRPTARYYFHMNGALFASFMEDGIYRSMELDRISSNLLASDNPPALWPLLKEEHLAFEKMDVPYFTYQTDGHTLETVAGKPIATMFASSAYDLVCSHMRKLDETHLPQQIAMLQDALSKEVTTMENVRSPLSQQAFLDKALSIAEKIAAVAPFSDDTGYDLYAGSFGVALFYAALAKVTQEEKFRAQALYRVERWQTEWTGDHARDDADQYGIGGATGLGSMVYALVRIAAFLQEPALLEEASQIAGMMTPERIAADSLFDIIGGAAGAVLGLVTLYEASQNKQVLEQAIQCGHHLLDHRVKSETGYRVWKNSLIKTPNGKWLTGFSHGAAGISYALFRLFHVTGHTPFRTAAQEAIAYEKSVFVPTVGNWPDYRVSRMVSLHVPNFMSSWCHGATGIGLARLGILPIWKDSAIRDEISIAVAKSKETPLKGTDDLCCGNFGRVEFLWTAAKRLSQEGWLDEALQQATWLIQREERRGQFMLSMNDHSANSNEVSFFKGLSGIGYQMLRLAFPDELPSVLLFE
jgi:lantibiotic modifying enzyme